MEAIFKVKLSTQDLGINTSQYSNEQLKELLTKELIENIKNYDFENALTRNPDDYITFRMDNPSIKFPKSKIPIF